MSLKITEKRKSNTVKARCTCVSEYQDKLYGTGIRIHNVVQKKDSTVKKCTSCGHKA
jgi:hypothetical protein